MTENIRLSWKGIWSHRMRSVLTMLGIIIGIAAIIIIISLIKGTNRQIEENLIGDGTHTVDIVLTQDGYEADFSYQEIPRNLPAPDSRNREKIAAMEHVERVSSYAKRSWADRLYYKNTELNSMAVYGIDEFYMETAGYEIVAGRGITAEDQNHFRKICLVDETVVSGVFSGKNPVGETLDISGECFTVAGVVAKKSTFEPVIETIQDYYTYVQEDTGAVYLPLCLWPSVYCYDEPARFLIKASSVDTMTAAGKDAADYLNSLMGDQESSYKYSSLNLAEQAAKLQSLSASTNFLMIGIAAISLLVGGIGVMNIMLVSVTERTKEIGLKKALGAKRMVILGQFLTEAALLSATGGLIGVIMGIIGARIIAAAAMVPVSISIPAIIISVGFSMTIGIIFGLAPSIKAANLNPIDALRYE